jgi:hypothetical protein
MLLAGNGKHASPGNDHRVQVTLKTGSGAELHVIEKQVLTGPGQIQLDDNEQPSTSDVLQVAIRRLDSSADDVLLCWLEAGGTIDRPWLAGRPLTADEKPGVR